MKYNNNMVKECLNLNRKIKHIVYKLFKFSNKINYKQFILSKFNIFFL
jgi:hypothetical protein